MARKGLESYLRNSRLLEVYSQVEMSMLEELAKGWKADPSLPDITRIRRHAAELQAYLNDVTPDMVRRELEQIAMRGADDAFRQVLVPSASIPTAPAVAMIVGETTTALRSVTTGLLRTTDDIYRAATQRSVAESLIRGEAIPETVKRQVQYLAGRGVSGFTDSAGRQWNMNSYTEMAVRTAKLRSYREQHSATLLSSGVDLIMVHGGNDMCDNCRSWMGKILSLDGSVSAGTHRVEALDGKYTTVDIAGTIDEARADGLEHPNCRCTRVGFFPGVSVPPEPNYDQEREKANDTLRGYEREIREQKRRKLFSDDPSRENQKIRRAQSRIRDLVKATGIPRSRSREQI